jgi:hypothetical protein
MAQAVTTPERGGPIPAGTAIIQPFIAGESSIPVVKIGAADQRKQDEQLTLIANRLETLAGEQVRMKRETEERWLRNIRAYHGFYDSTTEKNLKATGGSRAFVKATRAKTVALEARLFDLIFPTDDRNWGIEATPVPKLSKEGKQATLRAQNAAEQANDAEAAGNPQQAAQIVAEGNDEASRAQAAQAEIAKAREAADAMQEEMDDQLTESRYPAHSRDMIHDACMIGSGVLKGPMVNESTRGRWLPGENGGFALEQSDDPRPLIKRVDPWSFFPDMSATKIEDAEFTFERYLWTKKDLRRMVKTHGFNADVVREMLRDDRGKRPVASSGLHYLTQLRSITGEGDSSLAGRYIGWEYHGPLECDEIATILRALGEPDVADEYEQRDDPLEEFRVVVHFCEGQILKIAPEYPLDSGETLYSVFNIEEAEGNIFGYGIPEIMADSQIALNSAWRMGLDNAALSVGPQAIIDKESVVPADNSWTMLPKKIWHRTKAALVGQAPPIEFFNVPNNMNEIAAIIRIALEFIDMETGIPMPQQGDQTKEQTKTVGGMTILQNAANIIFRRMVKNYDDGIIAPTMRRLYDWNMQFNPNEKIKGDMQIDARGTAVLLLKEVQAQNLMFIVTQLMSHPAVQPMLKPYQNVTKLFQSMMIAPADVMLTEDEYKDNMKKLAEQPPPPDPAQINAESRIKAAEIAAQSRDSTNQASLQIAELRERTAMLELANSQGLTVEALKVELAKLDKKLASDERIKAVEIAVEDRRAREAKKDGRDEVEATGAGIG